MLGTKFASIHTGQSYLPVLMTPICYGPHFPFTNISQIITQRLYEASLLQRWYLTRNSFYMEIYKNIAKNSVFMDKPIIDFYAKTVDPYQHLTITEMQSLFFMTIYLSITWHLNLGRCNFIKDYIEIVGQGAAYYGSIMASILIEISKATLLGVWEDPGHRNYLYILWLTSLIPILEIIRNGLLVNLVNRPFISSHTIEDIMDDKLQVLTSRRNYKEWTGSQFIESLPNNSFKATFMRLVTHKLIRWDSLDTISRFSEITERPEDLHNYYKQVVILQDQTWTDVLFIFGSLFESIHVGESYLPFLITPLCFGPNTQRLYESSLLQYWYISRNKFIFKTYMTILENTAFNNRSVSDFYYQTPNPCEDLTTHKMKSLFIMTFICLGKYL
ncbi:unnamed protein product [Oppiella nova]|uniref:Uncharacterized protein n=1 Tax=Oppiella nova TaxID=334625 RepID=A0A7R9QTF4_9ACAR|nr:unnamed protein product [Oppiella nova]CAG2174229.1 unnamed protein product [Oppiella nova]